MGVELNGSQVRRAHRPTEMREPRDGLHARGFPGAAERQQRIGDPSYQRLWQHGKAATFSIRCPARARVIRVTRSWRVVSSPPPSLPPSLPVCLSICLSLSLSLCPSAPPLSPPPPPSPSPSLLFSSFRPSSFSFLLLYALCLLFISSFMSSSLFISSFMSSSSSVLSSFFSFHLLPFLSFSASPRRRAVDTR